MITWISRGLRHRLAQLRALRLRLAAFRQWRRRPRPPVGEVAPAAPQCVPRAVDPVESTDPQSARARARRRA